MRTNKDFIKDYFQKIENKLFSIRLKNPIIKDEDRIALLEERLKRFKKSFKALNRLNDVNRAFKKLIHFYSEVDKIKRNQKGELNGVGMRLYNQLQLPLNDCRELLETKKIQLKEQSQSSLESYNPKYKGGTNERNGKKSDYDRFIDTLMKDGTPEFMYPTKEGYDKSMKKREARNGKIRIRSGK
ncbi:hypothetical protein [uncultured Aquimarina sp.]|uniref:hypothetical protein n=1 Tax=uncultured Aquimarina sp. TaxID=575652 RepID=UPI002634F796|nr:hypothetical protein [uncultured Aquimarina sp.]